MHRALACPTFHSLFSLITLNLLRVAFCNALPVPEAPAAALYPRQLTGPAPLSPIGLNPLSGVDPTQSFSDGGGTGFNAPAIVWIVFASLLGFPLAFAGVRGWRITSGIGLGLTLSFFIWSAFVNTTTGASLAANPVTSDLFLSLFVLGMFLLGVAFGALRIGILAGVCSLGASGGAALGILIALLRPGLLIPIYALNIVPIGLLGLAGAAWPIWHQRLAVIVSSSACGSFLIGLAVDLILNKQSGMSRGIRYLLDRNSVHLAASLQAGYNPSLSTWIIVGVSIGVIPVFSYIQHRIFRQPFDRTPESLDAYNRLINGSPILGPGDEGYIPPISRNSEEKFAVAPQHVRMRFPSIIPSLPGRVDPRYTAQQQAMRREREAMEAEAARADPTFPGRPIPGPGIGRMNFVPGWGVAVTAVKRMSTTFTSGAARRLSTNFASGAARRMSTTFGFGGGNGNGQLKTAAVERRVSTLSVPSIYSVASRQNGYAYNGHLPQQQSQQTGAGPSGLQYTNTHAYAGIQLPSIRPLQLANRQHTTSTPTRNTAPPPQSSYAPSTRRGGGGGGGTVVVPPSASLRNDRNGWGANGIPPTPTANRSAPNTPNRSTPNTPNRTTPGTPNPNRTELGYYGESPATSRSVGSSSNGNGNGKGNANAGAASREAGRNRLKTATRYNLL